MMLSCIINRGLYATHCFNSLLPQQDDTHRITVLWAVLEDSITLDKLDEKWEVDGQSLPPASRPSRPPNW